MTRPLRPYQQTAIESVRSSLVRGVSRVVLQLATGAGKTRVAAEIGRGALSKGNRLVFVVPALSLIPQTIEAFWNEGIRDVGVIQGDHDLTDWRRPVQIASAQTIARRGRFPSANIVIVDEVHRWFKIYETWMADPEWRRKPFIGLSATPWTRGLGRHFEDLIIGATTAELIEAGYLSPFRVFAPSHPDLTGVRTLAGDYHEGDLGEAMNKAPLVADIVETWKQRAANRPTLCFAVDRAHAKALERQFHDAGVPAGYVDAFTDMEERRFIIRCFEAGELKVLVNIGCLTTGVDLPFVSCIVLARPTRSEMLYMQIVGRGLRTAPGKSDLLLLDHSDSTLRLGFPTEIGHDKLDDGTGAKQRERKKAEALPKECPSCHFLRPPKVHECPACGFRPAPQAIQCEEGELVELRAKPRGATVAEKEHLYGQLRVYARRHGYAEGWASHKFRERFGGWPNFYRDAPDVEPTQETLSWIRSRQIAYAKRRAS